MTDGRHCRTSLSCIRPAVSMSTTSKSLSRADIKSEDYLHMKAGINAYRNLSLLSRSQRHLCHNLARTIQRAPCCPSLRQPRASRDCERGLEVVRRRHSCKCIVVSRHAGASIFDAPESITCRNEDTKTVLNEPEADFREIGAFSNAVDPNEGNAVRKPLLGSCYGRGQLGSN